MFDTMTITKAGGALCGALLIFLLGNWGAEMLYATEAGGHGEEEAAQAYVIDTGASEDTSAAADEGPDFATLFASASAEDGAKVFGKCKACHKIDGTNATGPHLDGVVNRKVDSVDGYSYSGALEEHFDVWTPEHLFAFLENPKSEAPGTKMSFAGLKKGQDRANLIKYLESLGG